MKINVSAIINFVKQVMLSPYNLNFKQGLGISAAVGGFWLVVMFMGVQYSSLVIDLAVASMPATLATIFIAESIKTKYLSNVQTQLKTDQELIEKVTKDLGKLDIKKEYPDYKHIFERLKHESKTISEEPQHDTFSAYMNDEFKECLQRNLKRQSGEKGLEYPTTLLNVGFNTIAQICSIFLEFYVGPILKHEEASKKLTDAALTCVITFGLYFLIDAKVNASHAWEQLNQCRSEVGKSVCTLFRELKEEDKKTIPEDIMKLMEEYVKEVDRVAPPQP